jgi:hypothetical protein
MCADSSNLAVATADDYGRVKLFKYPCMEATPYRVYRGHAAHVTNISFLAEQEQYGY